MSERLYAIAGMIEKQQRNIEMQEANYQRFKSYSVFYRGKQDDNRHDHEMEIKEMALVRLKIAYNNIR